MDVMLPSSASTTTTARPPYTGGNIRHNKEKIFPWEKEAEEVLRVYKPKCIVLDLDFTLWPTFFSTHTAPPYVPLFGRPSQLLCVDKMTKKPRMLHLYPEVLQTIQFCLKHGIMISIASKNSNREDAESILKSLGIWHQLIWPQIFYSRKTFHFRNLKSATSFDYSDFMFFDDDGKNVSVCKNIGVNSFRVNRATGFNGKVLLHALKECASKYERSYEEPCCYSLGNSHSHSSEDSGDSDDYVLVDDANHQHDEELL